MGSAAVVGWPFHVAFELEEVKSQIELIVDHVFMDGIELMVQPHCL